MLRHWELYLQEVIKGQRQGFVPTVIKIFLVPLSWLFQLVVSCRNWFFDQGWPRCYNPPVRAVISVGNIVAGGTGKTPVTLMLAKAFYDRYSIAILSRGYRSPAERFASPLTLCEGSGPQYSALYCGDEPYLLATHLPKAHVFVGKNKRIAARMAADAGVDMVIIDDGMQHRRLIRDFDIVILDAADPFGGGFFLPRGFLREGPKSLNRVQLIIVNHVENEEQFEKVKKLVRPYSSAPIIGTEWHVAALLDLADDGYKIDSIKLETAVQDDKVTQDFEVESLLMGGDHFQKVKAPPIRTDEGSKDCVNLSSSTAISRMMGKKVGMFCGIAHPESFRQTVLDLGADIVAEDIFPDHLIPDSARLELFAERCAGEGAECIICTEKDCVKLEEAAQFCIPVVWVQMELQVVKGIEEWNHFLREVESKVG
jgi:tetraacyldisaccharide 4'-kinase